MNLPHSAIFVIILIIGFLTSSTLYFYNKSRTLTGNKGTNSTSFEADVPQPTASENAKKVDELTKPAEPRNRLTYPANVYIVQPKETLFAIGEKFGLSYQRIKAANGVTNENLIQADFALAIPKLDSRTDYYRINFLVNEDRASELTRELRDKQDDPLFNPIEVAKKDAVPYFGVATSDTFTILEQDLAAGTALIQAKSADRTNVIGLIQPKIKGKTGFWGVLYVEER